MPMTLSQLDPDKKTSLDRIFRQLKIEGEKLIPLGRNMRSLFIGKKATVIKT